MYNNNINFLSVLRQRPQAVASLKGNDDYPNLSGYAKFFQTNIGVMVLLQVLNLPRGIDECDKKIYAVHIHSGNSCSGTEADPFADSMSHYNPADCLHPYHAGDMPPIFSCSGYAFSMFLTDRFSVKDIIGKTIIIHSGPDDFTTQPAGNSGDKIACGVIQSNR